MMDELEYPIKILESCIDDWAHGATIVYSITKRIKKAVELLKEQQPKWIPVTERLPEIEEGHEYYGTRCIVCNNNKQVFTLRYCKHVVRKKEVYRWMCEDMNIYYGEVVCWMPLPEPPKDGEQDA